MGDKFSDLGGQLMMGSLFLANQSKSYFFGLCSRKRYLAENNIHEHLPQIVSILTPSIRLIAKMLIEI